MTSDDDPNPDDMRWPRIYGVLFCIAVTAMVIAALIGATARV